MAFPVYLKNGERVNINDHVYCSPSWAVRDGTPYSVARIMEFLGPQGTPKGSEGKFYHQTRVRLAWYYRPSDVSDRPVADPRLLLAAIYSEVCDINQLRAKCHVIHRDKITDLAGWKKRPDRFYFNRLFDPYLKREFEIIQATDVRNLPDNIRENLTSRYEYVVAEKEVIPDLTDAVRLCGTCSDWCPTLETVQCDRCKKYFHMRCVQPPLLAKPSRGYGWTCAPCSRRHEEEVDSHEVRHVTPVVVKVKTNAPAPRGRGRPRKDRSLAEKEERFPVKYYKGWPFRYFGQHTIAEDTLDPDDLIFPRAAIRIGPKYQGNVPAMYSAPDTEERGGDSTIEVLSVVSNMTSSRVAEVEELLESRAESSDERHSVDWLTENIRLFSKVYQAGWFFSSMGGNPPMRLLKWKKHESRYVDKPWTRDEIAAFEDTILSQRKHGAELRAVMERIPTRSMPEIVRFYGQWKNSQLKRENARIREFGIPTRPVWSRWDTIAEASEGQHVGLSDDEGSIADDSPEDDALCGACRTRESKIWWKAPKGLLTDVLCDTCGTSWRKYADLNVRPLREESLPSAKAKLGEKREPTPLAGPSAKRTRRSASQPTTPPPANVNHPTQPIRCIVCESDGPVGKVVKCRQCQFRAHIGACGAVVDPASVDGWRCEVCENEETLEASINSSCLLCPRYKKKQGQAHSFLRAHKPTEGQGWAHVLCSVFISELTFTDSARLRLVEGISTIPPHRWSTTCSLCGNEQGAVIRCSECPREYHVSCAWLQGYKFGFEMQPVKSSRRDTTLVTSFKGETGCMTPIVCCRQHDNRRRLYSICETNEFGETAMEVYCQFYKQAAVTQAHGLLRKARRLDQVLNSRGEVAISASSSSSTNTTEPIPNKPREPLSERQCFKCQTTFSPLFYPLPDPVVLVHSGGGGRKADDTKWLCHRCHFQSREKTDVVVVVNNNNDSLSPRSPLSPSPKSSSQ